MRLLHISDVHAGKRLHGYSQEEDLAHALAQVVDVCRERSVDCVLVAGDLYDTTQPPDYAVALVDGFLRGLAEAGVRVVAVPGNHDSAARVGFASPLLAASGVHVSGPLEGPVEPVVLADAHGEVRVWPVPFVRPATVRAALGCDAVLLTPTCADPLARRCVRVSMGCVFSVPWARAGPWPAEGVDALHDLGFTVVACALSPDALELGSPEADAVGRPALLFGTEGDGLAASTVALADRVVRIPMAHGVDSLNVAAASAVFFWQYCRR